MSLQPHVMLFLDWRDSVMIFLDWRDSVFSFCLYLFCCALPVSFHAFSRPQSAGLLQHSEDVPAPVARPPTAHLTARELRAGLGTARQRRHQNHGDIVGWRDLAL